jgi:type IV fimbrial biogenesis protein FimT
VPRATRTWGFTLIELMLALGLLALLLVLGMPSFTAFVRNSEIRSTAESIINGLRTSLSEATNRNRPVTFTLAGAGSADWTMTWVDDDGNTQTIQTYSKREAGPNTVIALTPADKRSVTFTELGRVQNAGTGDHVRQIDIAPAVAGEARSLRIIVDDPNPTDPAKPRGLRMCDPDPGLAALTPPDPRAC